MRLRQILYFASYKTSVFDSQVVAYLNELSVSDDYIVFAFIGVNKKDDKEKIKNKFESKVTVIFYDQFPIFSLFVNRQTKAIQKVIKDNIINTTIKTVLHIRTESILIPIFKAFKNKEVEIIADIRGALVEEAKYYSSLNLLFKLFKVLYYKNCRKRISKYATKISVVSDDLKSYVLKYNKSLNPEKVFVNHSFASDIFIFNTKVREEVRTKLGIKEGEVVFVFSSGGSALWQNSEFIINNLVANNYKVINLSKQVMDKQNVINLFVDYNDVPLFLNAADIAIIWRHKDIVNKVASPVKFSEYVCCGLPVISNESVGLIIKYINETGYGQLMCDLNEINNDTLTSFQCFNREEISNNAIKLFGIEKSVKSYMTLYQ